MADSIGVLLLTWNQAFYRYGFFDFGELEACLRRNLPVLTSFRKREISSYKLVDDPEILRLFKEFLDALRIRDKDPDGPSSPVASSKALHLIAPRYFPIWDRAIAKAYKCDYSSNPAKKYISFIHLMKEFASRVPSSFIVEYSPKSVLKLIDEYNYAHITKEWV